MYKTIKRFLDIICALLGIIGTSPFWLIAMVGILVSDWGPLFYTSSRIGKNNKTFRMFKFRSMRLARGADERSLRADENRIFTFGQFMRKVKIDELPQLLNVLNGTMSVIGPRPVSKDQKDLFRTGKWNLAAKVSVGMSGPAALYDFLVGDSIKNEAEYMEKVFPTRRELEYVYVKRMSFGYDLKIVWWTIVSVASVFFGKAPTRIINKLIKDAGEYKN